MTDIRTLPDLSTPYDLGSEQVASYRKNGHVLLRGVASPQEVQVYRDLITKSTQELAKTYKPMAERDTYGKAFIQNMNLWVNDEGVRRFSLSRRFAKIAADLMGVEGVRVYHDQALYKEPGGGHTPWHQDQQYWPLDGVKCVTLWMPLVDVTAEMGTMRFADGSQELGYLGALNISDDSEAQLEDLIREKGYPVSAAGDMSAGDATFHDGWCIHGAPGNSSTDQTREVMTIIYLEDGARISEPDSPQRQLDLETWFPGRKPGDFAASDLNPLVYRR
ncbi:MAG: phytanoyl-CoA dioxygenase family protein [Armatimonadetes bacterium]|nr:phytanoyl-CoA dioxygenase family protein [Armatimonadota bacterium]